MAAGRYLETLQETWGPAMAGIFASGRAVDVVIAVMAIKIGYLIAFRRRRTGSVLRAFLPGVLILLALRVALTGGAWWWVALFLGASFPPHLADLRRRGW